MVNDILQDSKEHVKLLNETILESSNFNFRQMTILLRNSAESFEGELYKISESKGYTLPSLKTEESEINAIKKMFL